MSKATELARAIRKARQELGLDREGQQDLLRALRERYELTNPELATALGYSFASLLAYLAREGAAMHRRMPDADRLVIGRVLGKQS